jgi:hypothetical protein
MHAGEGHCTLTWVQLDERKKNRIVALVTVIMDLLTRGRITTCFFLGRGDGNNFGKKKILHPERVIILALNQNFSSFSRLSKKFKALNFHYIHSSKIGKPLAGIFSKSVIV